MSTIRQADDWWTAATGKVHERVFQYVAEIERAQGDIYERIARVTMLYDPEKADDGRGRQAQVTENLIASNVDTVHAIIATTEIRPRLLTDDGDWKVQRQARRLTWYAEGLMKLLKIHRVCRRSFKLGALKGMGLVKVGIDPFNRIQVRPVLVDDIVVDESETRNGDINSIRQLHHLEVVSAAELLAAYPRKKDLINKARGRRANQRHWADYRPIEKNQVGVIESWYLPIGVKGEKGYQAGLHTVVADGVDLLREDWEEPFFPLAEFRWSEKACGWYGIGLAERIAGHQRTTNKINWQVDLQLDKHAVPTTYVPMVDATIAIKTTNRAGTFVPYKASVPPTTVIPPAVSGEVYRRQEYLKQSAGHESGVSEMAAHATKPAGIDSGAAMREYRDATTQRFNPQEKDHEQLLLDTLWLALWCCKKLGDKAPVIVRRSKNGPKRISWPSVDMREVRVQLVASSALSKTPHGRTAFVLELAQGGVISQDLARRLIMPNSPLDVERELSLYTAATDAADDAIESILEGNIEVPDGFHNLAVNVWRGQAMFLRLSREGWPEHLLENLRQFVVQSAWLLSQKEAAAAPQPGLGGEVAPGTGAPADMPMPTDPTMPPMAGDPGAAMTGAGVTPAGFLQ